MKFHEATGSQILAFSLVFTGLQDSPKLWCTVEPPIVTDPPTSGQPLYNGHWLCHQLTLLLHELVFNQPPTSGRFLIPDSDKLRAPNRPTLYDSASYNGQTAHSAARRLMK